MKACEECTRRDFIIAASAGACALGLGYAWSGELSAAPAPPAHKARYWEKLKKGVVHCTLCPKNCHVPDGKRGACEVRENRGGSYYTLVYSNPCTYHNDPIEKKPLYHYLPGTNAFSIATAGCNIECRFCQNWQISQARPSQLRSFDMPPEEVIRLTKKAGSPTIAYTYSEPVIFTEYMYDTAALARKQGLGNVMISNGYIQEQPMRDLCDVLSAVKVDLKAFTEEFYRDLCSGELQPVLDTLKLLKRVGMWNEIVVLLVPTKNDSAGEIDRMTKWIVENLGPGVPVHFTRFHPCYKITNLPPTPIETLERARKIAMSNGVHFAYLGNVPGHPGNNTYCPRCGHLLVKRIGYHVSMEGLKDGKCKYCGCPIPGVWYKADV
jgi:pyruvate formate lyase activating enzyme